ncbi:uncharacterized protein EMH_0006930 [Eimeria mitis]|uniref:Btz domain-containing protein n=1 Tax=Eimeria mitis TaxID=44415 RepID=U6K2P9_9EIME|nr:uncharacterized protein EMH_0006930 [Eimeria mitis]CDJ30602.1 hypothetical protein, conserved [Eimeria mitis]
MGNPRNLRRTSSQEEDEGDVFDEKSDISSGSESEEEAAADAAPRGGAAATATTTATAAAAGDSSAGAATPAASAASSSGKDENHEPNEGPPAAASDAQASSEPLGEAEHETQKKTEQTNDESIRPGRGAPADGARQRPKSTWQLMQEDPSYVPRATRYFLHDDRREGDSGDSEASEEGSGNQPDDSVPQSTQTRVGPSKKLWTPDENKGVWKHDMWELLQKEEAEGRPPGGSWSRGRNYGRRGGATLGYRRGGRVESWVPRGSRGGRLGSIQHIEKDSTDEHSGIIGLLLRLLNQLQGGEDGGRREGAGEVRTGATGHGSNTFQSSHRSKLQRRLERRGHTSAAASPWVS